MSLPRRILPYSVYLITRRCTQRMSLLRPDKKTNQIINYCLAEAARRYNINLIAWLAMSNHYHAVVHDPRGELPAFLAHFHKMVAKALNHRWDRKENLWSSSETSVVELFTRDDILSKVVYVLTNPVTADLVDKVSEWPGASSWNSVASNMTAEERHARPEAFFNSKRKRMPDDAPLHAVVPPALRDEKPITNEAWAELVRTEVERREFELRDSRIRQVLGAERVLRKSPRSIPKKTNTERRDRSNAKGRKNKRKLRPAIACKNKRLRRFEIKRLQCFREAYAQALLLYLAGDSKVRFPAGTYKLFRQCVICESFKTYDV